MTSFLMDPDVQGAHRIRLVAQGFLPHYSSLGVPASLPLRLLASRYDFVIDDLGKICLSPWFKSERNSESIDYYNWIGCDFPFYVLVGEKLSSQAPTPWYPFIGGPAARYLWSALSPMNFGVFNALAITNAIGEEPLLLDKVRSAAKVVALGSKAGKVLSDYGIRHETVYHPSYARRWAQVPVEQYRETLLRVLGLSASK